MDAHTLRTIAVTVQCDPRTVRRLCRGERVHPIIADRIRQAIAELDLEIPPPVVARAATEATK